MTAWATRGILAAMFLCVLGQVPIPGAEIAWMKPIIELGPMGLLGAVVLMFTWKIVPLWLTEETKRTTLFAETVKAIADKADARAIKRDEDFVGAIEKNSEALAMLREHCAGRRPVETP